MKIIPLCRAKVNGVSVEMAIVRTFAIADTILDGATSFRSTMADQKLNARKIVTAAFALVHVFSTIYLEFCVHRTFCSHCVFSFLYVQYEHRNW